MNENDFDRFERAVSALIVDYGISSVALSAFFRDNGDLRCLTMKVDNGAVRDLEASFLVSTLYQNGMQDLTGIPGTRVLSEQRGDISVVTPKKQTDDH